MLVADDEPSGARIIRLMLKNVSSKKPNNRPSPAKAKGSPNWRRNDDDSDDDSESDAPDDAEEEVNSDESDGMSDDGAAASACATAPWASFTKKRLWTFRTDRDGIMKSAAGLKTKLEVERATATSLRVQLGLADARLLELDANVAARDDGAAVVYDTAAMTKLRDVAFRLWIDLPREKNVTKPKLRPTQLK